MNQNLQFIFRRRSVRRYTDQPVADTVIQDLLEAAMAAPSAVAKDPWHFIVIRNRDTLLKLTGFMPNAQMLKQAPAAIVVCGDVEKAHDKQESYMLQDCSAAIENTLLAAAALGLGSCWLGIHPRKDRMQGIRDLFRLPDHIIPVAGIALGYPEEVPAPRTRYQGGCIHSEKW